MAEDMIRGIAGMFRGSQRRKIPKSIKSLLASKTAESTKKSLRKPGLDVVQESPDSAERLVLLLIELLILLEFFVEFIDPWDIERLSSEINGLLSKLENRVLSSPELLQAKDLIYDTEDLIDDMTYCCQEFQRFGRKENWMKATSCKGDILQLELRNLIVKIQNSNGLGSDDVCFTQPKDSAVHRDDLPPLVAEKNLIELEDVLEHEANSIVGMEDSKEEVITCLLVTEEEFRIISICGMGGLGKTTLAQRVYEDQCVRKSFDCLGWARVGENFSTRKVLEDILTSVTCHKWEDMVAYTALELAEKLYNFLKQKRYLIVLDDIWGMDAWDCLSLSFPTSDKTGSRLLLTTRSTEIASKISTSLKGFVHRMRCLTQQESWDLLLKTAFRAQKPDPKDVSELNEVGKEIIQACSGVPLMVKLVGGLLISKTKAQQWKMVCENIVLSLKMDQDYDGIKGVTSILKLSFDSLPCYLKPCFLYVAAMFPKGANVEAESLYRMWLAEGYVVPATDPSGKISSMDIAEWYLYELHIRNLVSVHKPEIRYAMRFESFQLHDLLHDLCLLKGRENNFCVDKHFGRANDEKLSSCSSPDSTHRIIRLALYFEDGASVPSKGKRTKKLESPEENQQESIPLRKLSDLWDVSQLKGLYLRASKSRWIPSSVNLRNWSTSVDFLLKRRDPDDLRRLDLGDMKRLDLDDVKRLRLIDCDGFNLDVMGLIPTMEKLSKLRYLSLRNCFIERFPSSISNLSNLQTLRLPECTKSRMLIPNEIQCLSSLRFLILPHRFEVQGGGKLHLYKLINLEELVNFDSTVCEVKELRVLTKLKRLVAILEGNSEVLQEINRSAIRNSFLVSSLVVKMSDDSNKNLSIIEDLCRFPNLSILCLEGIYRSLPWPIFHDLNKLSFSGSDLDEDPMEKLGKLPNLQVLELCNNAVAAKYMNCSASGMPHLRHLTLSNLENLEKVSVAQGGMPELSTLTLQRCKRLKDPPEGLIFLTSLQELNVLYMPPAFVDRLNKIGEECLPRVKHAYFVKTNQLF
ncbi:OLC1v1019576C2 [Oldenlandia corymbosa var. corymbosa]|uniref:OLC1v1019576C2 n=1 Tax=Oldenlandia corymbosa var. corymbosa TaxID=529605 RepID=A0AAV1EEA6_OLDCO|nr:OLC1v1019576C2 [Oldenlandia corymbosa var. corymbosa]